MNIDSPLDTTNSPFEFPPFNLDMFIAALEDGPIPQPTAEELQAHQFLRALLKK